MGRNSLSWIYCRSTSSSCWMRTRISMSLSIRTGACTNTHDCLSVYHLHQQCSRRPWMPFCKRQRAERLANHNKEVDNYAYKTVQMANHWSGRHKHTPVHTYLPTRPHRWSSETHAVTHPCLQDCNKRLIAGQ